MKTLITLLAVATLFTSCGNEYKAFDNGVSAIQASDKVDQTEREATQRAVLMVKSEAGKSKGKHLIDHTTIDGKYNVGDTVSSTSMHTTVVIKLK